MTMALRRARAAYWQWDLYGSNQDDWMAVRLGGASNAALERELSSERCGADVNELTRYLRAETALEEQPILRIDHGRAL